MIRLLIADDHEILREGLKYVVSQSRDISVVGEADDAESTLQLCRTTPADVLLLDVSMPGPGVLDTIKSVKAIQAGAADPRAQRPSRGAVCPARPGRRRRRIPHEEPFVAGAGVGGAPGAQTAGSI